MIENIILTVILLLIAGGALLYLYKAKRRGEKCIGCPYAKECKRHECGVTDKE
ncbi:MAG: FeoB-associated Cys-rich membrane protein [Clostridia bacterium]|nr:FeoB-associated Cys-rich membrane protein [Clostridia bacterium]